MKKTSSLTEIRDYDDTETTGFIDKRKRLKISDLGLKLPETPPTQVVSIRLPTPLLNQIRARASAQDIPYQALIKILLSRSLKKAA